VAKASGFKANFAFRSRPRTGSKLRVRWYYNNRVVWQQAKGNTDLISAFLRARGGMPRGYFRCLLAVRIPDDGWKPVKQLVARVG
jgi:hypothetical protein